ncbi:MAG: hypothetical protein RLZZ385_1607 [Pseudomonadota bacterium]
MAAIEEGGLRPHLFKVMAGASGGPKWFVLYGLDRYLFGEFFRDRQAPLATVGSSAGAWRLACLASADPLAAIERLATLYSRERYSEKPDSGEVTDKARRMLHDVLGPVGLRRIVSNTVVQSHFIAVRGRGLLSSRHRPLLGAGLGAAALSNLASRSSLGWYFERIVFNNHAHGCELSRLQDLPTRDVKLTEDNVADALLASGSIPLVLDGVRDIQGAGPGLYLDGGITDYHFDLPFHSRDGLVLYPHFYPRVVPGWFDKHLPWREVEVSHYDNVLLVVPSAKFVSRLPYGKIPDRGDFRTLDYQTRIKYWQAVLDQSQRLADAFHELVDGPGSPCIALKPFVTRAGRRARGTP